METDMTTSIPKMTTEELRQLTDKPYALADLFDGVANELDTNGWTRGRYNNSRGAHCVIGAMYSQLGEIVLDAVTPLETEFRTVLQADARVSFAVVHWNDMQKDKRYVTRRCRSIARRLRGAKR